MKTGGVWPILQDEEDRLSHVDTDIRGKVNTFQYQVQDLAEKRRQAIWQRIMKVEKERLALNCFPGV